MKTRDKSLLCVILLAIVVRLLYLFDSHGLLWDSGVYVGMGKFLWSWGTAGVWEHIRPVLWPFALGFFWKLSLDPIFWSRMLSFVLSIGSIILVYKISELLFSKRTALFASIVFSFSAIFFFFGFHAYAEIPALFLVLAGVYALLKQKEFLSGLLFGFAFLTKFPAGMFLLIGIGYFIWKKQTKSSFIHMAGFALPAGAYFIANWIFYGNPFVPLIAAHETIRAVLGCNVLRFKPFWQYFIWIFSDNWLNLAALIGLFVAVRKRSWFILACLALPLVYFLQLSCREYRYLLLFLPFVSILTGLGLVWIEKRLPKYAKHAFVLFVIAVSVFSAVMFYQGNEIRSDPVAESYFVWLSQNPVQGEVWSSTPVVSVYSDVKINKIYYPVYDEGKATGFNKYLVKNADRIGAVLLDNCGGGIICPPDDAICAKELASTRTFLNQNFKQVFFNQKNNCWYAIYTK